jgi:hypothetical protein
MTKRKFCFLAFCALVPALIMASVASATLSMNVGATSADVGVAVTITISSDAAEEITWGVYLDPTSDYPSNAQMQNATILAAAGGSGSVTSGGNPDAGHDYASAGKGANAPYAGNWSTVEFVGLAVGTYTIDLYQPAGGAQLATADIEVVPEPSTVALLGFGTLVLLRTRRH